MERRRMTVALLASLALHLLFLALWMLTSKPTLRPVERPLQITLVTLPPVEPPRPESPPAPLVPQAPAPPAAPKPRHTPDRPPPTPKHVAQPIHEQPAPRTEPPRPTPDATAERATPPSPVQTNLPEPPKPPHPDAASAAAELAQAPQPVDAPLLPEPPRPGSPETSHPIAVESPTAPAHAPTGTGNPADSPRIPTLSLAPALEGTGKGGTLIINTGEDPAAKKAAAIQAQRDAEAQVQTWAATDLGSARVHTGGVDSYFAQMRQTLEATAKDAPPFKVVHAATEFFQSYKANAARYGATGSVASGESKDPDLRNFERRLSGPPLNPGSRDEAIARGLGGTRVLLNELSQTGEGMVALIEIHQDRMGKLVETKLVRTSGSKVFDRYALGQIPKALEKLPPPGERARGTSPDGIHTLWAFRGVISYLRPAKDFKAKDLAYLMATGAISALAGNFDLATGEVNVIDLRHPRYLCKVRLLSVY